uniref:Integrase, catalytic region, zinc finger, CCHC-type, peptidase aspartic, catalytic n=1 Tax=Tanacetum cinerariifolium TaxID=118510 RepID=A0A6L2L1M6_TANCI|nr:hypothetical protein [Tanacetum cinerariifolium]
MFKEGDFLRLCINEIKEMLLVVVQNRLINLSGDDVFDFAIALRMFTRSLVIQKRVEDLQLGVESYQKKINVTKPKTTKPDIKKKDTYTSYQDPQGFIYVDTLYKFSDRTLTGLQTLLDDITKNIRMEYLPKRRWSTLEKKRANIMIKAIDKQLKERRMMRSLEKFVGGRHYGTDLRLLQRIIYNLVILSYCNPNGNGNVVVARAEGNAIWNNGNKTQLLITQKKKARIQLQAKDFDLMVATADLDEIEEVNANCILMANLQQASTSGTQIDTAPVYDLDGSAEVHNYDNCYDNEIFNMFTQEEKYTELLELIPEPHHVQQNDSNVISEVSSMEQDGRTVEQHPANVEETRTLYDSLYNNLVIKVEKVNTVNRKLRETNDELTTELARYKNHEKCIEISQEKYDKLERCYQKSVYQEQCLAKKINALHLSFSKQIMTLNEEISNVNKQLSMEKSTVSSLLKEKKKLKSDFKIREDELLDKQIQLENKIKELDNI